MSLFPRLAFLKFSICRIGLGRNNMLQAHLKFKNQQQHQVAIVWYISEMYSLSSI